MSETLSIGSVAERSGLKVTALRFYEDRGLISSHRNDGNQRRYNRDVLRRLAVIAAAQHVGFTLNEISEMLADLPTGTASDEANWQSIASSWRPHL
ncbi:MAG: redox-sensitive transcriptional activator SoxR, partial [Acidimicrobiales bacterium]